jgi:pimeloyl-ACP methyl ester carboxylesterase
VAAAFPDVVVLLPGISGSALAKDGKEVWGTSSGTLWNAVTSVGDSIRQLKLGEDDPTVDDLADGITATRLIPDLHMIPGLWKIDGYSATTAYLLQRGLKAKHNYFEFPYDWRRDNRVSARRLQRATQQWLQAWRTSSGNDKAKLILISHSMGGIVARYYLEVLSGWRDTRSLITFGTPYRGSLNAVGYLANGYAKGIGPLKVDFSETIRSFTALYQLLPTFKCVDKGDGKVVRVGETSGLPNIDATRAARALAFHQEIHEAQERNAQDDAYRRNGYKIFPVVGIEQPTFVSAVLRGVKLELSQSLEGKVVGGDSVVPRVSATPLELSDQRREMFAAEAHASLQNFAPVLTQVEGVLTGNEFDLGDYEAVVAAQVTLGLDLQDVYGAGPVEIIAKPSEPVPLEVQIFDAPTRRLVAQAPLRASADGYARASVTLSPGAYRVTVGGDNTVSPVTDACLVIDPGAAQR